MKLGHTVKRIIFTSSPLILSLVAMEAGCSSADTGGVGAGVSAMPPVDTGTIVDQAPAPDDTPKDLPGFKGSDACKKCHVTIYDDWQSSMHAHALTSPIMIVQTNQVFAADLIKNENQGQAQFCTNCHSPVAVLFAKSGTLPFVSKKANATTEALQEGIGCVTCHAYRGNPRDSKAAQTDFQQDFSVGKNYYGPFDDPAPNGGFHQATTSPLYTSGVENLCLSCHNVKNDRDGDKIFELGVDLFLQTTFDEYNIDYRINGNGEQTCDECHMPARNDIQQAADGFPNAPFRTVHDHKFAGVDYPLDQFAAGKDPQKFARRDLLNGGATGDAVASLSIQNVNFADGANLSFDVEIINSNGGHNLPTGFAFTRQMWLEIVVKDNNMNELASSGELQDPNNDLCDNDTLIDNLANVIQGCQNNVADPQLVNFQTILVDFVALQNGILIKDPVKGHETWLQFQSGGAVARSRPADVALGLLNTVAPIKPFETRSFHYAFTFAKQDEQIRLGTKLKFRNLPPYFVRRLAQADSGKFVNLGSLLSFDVIDMQSDFQNVQVGQQ